MRDKSLLPLFLWLNVGLAACFVCFVVLSTGRQPNLTTTTFRPLVAATSTPPATAAAAARSTNAVANADPGSISGSPATNAASSGSAAAAGSTNDVAVASDAGAFAQPGKPIGWEQLDRPEYDRYLASLKAVGCPEPKVRHIILSDIDEFLGKRRLKEAVTHDMQWWKAEMEPAVTTVLQEKGRTLDEERNRLIAKYLGPAAVDEERGEAMLWSNVQLTGPVLGALPPEVHNRVQEICGRSIDRHQSSFWARVNEGQPANPVEMARLREQTRVDLRKVLKPEAMEEFLLRYSQNANQLRLALRGMDPTPDEFRKIFRATDALDHQLQLEYGGPEALSQEQRERYERQRDAAIREALGPDRYHAYLMTKDPVYRQAQATAQQYGAPAKAIQPVYDLLKEIETRRQKVLNDATLAGPQKSQALNAILQEQIRGVQKIVTETAGQR